jgi:hypothetical protein
MRQKQVRPSAGVKVTSGHKLTSSKRASDQFRHRNSALSPFSLRRYSNVSVPLSRKLDLAGSTQTVRDLPFLKRSVKHLKSAVIVGAGSQRKSNLRGKGFAMKLDWDESAQLRAVAKNPWVISSILHPSEAVQLAAVSKLPWTIERISSPTLRVQLAAVRIDGRVISVMPHPSRLLQLEAVVQDPGVINILFRPSDETLLLSFAILNSVSSKTLRSFGKFLEKEKNQKSPDHFPQTGEEYELISRTLHCPYDSATRLREFVVTHNLGVETLYFTANFIRNELTLKGNALLPKSSSQTRSRARPLLAHSPN